MPRSAAAFMIVRDQHTSFRCGAEGHILRHGRLHRTKPNQGFGVRERLPQHLPDDKGKTERKPKNVWDAADY